MACPVLPPSKCTTLRPCFPSGSEGLKFFKDNLQIGKCGLVNTATGESMGNLAAEDIEFFEMLGKGAAAYVQRALYKPKNIALAIKANFRGSHPC